MAQRQMALMGSSMQRRMHTQMVLTMAHSTAVPLQQALSRRVCSQHQRARLQSRNQQLGSSIGQMLTAP